MYHEKQSFMRCGLHALNNLLQEPVITSEDMTRASQSLLQLESSINPTAGVLLYVPLLRDHYKKLSYEFPFGYGNYDVNVLIYILQEKGYTMKWIDSDAAALMADTAIGILCNVVTKRWFTWKKLEQRHWFAIKQIEGVYYNLDSMLQEPEAFDSREDLQQFLEKLSDSQECQFFKIERS